MSDLMIGILSFPAVLLLIFLRVPIGLAMFATGLVGLILVTGDASVPLGRLKSETFTTFSSYSLSIIPMFLLMGHFATLGGMFSRRDKSRRNSIAYITSAAFVVAALPRFRPRLG